MLCSAFHAILPNAKNLSLMHLEGVVSLGAEDLFLPRVLFDTGALSSSYVSLQWVEDNK